MINVLILVFGLFFGAILFCRFPVMGEGVPLGAFPTISVIIPARNEERSLPLLLQDLQNQRSRVHEIICVDDGSTDETANIAGSFGVTLISQQEKPPGWVGKSWACQKGAEAASGDVLLFLDADVRIGLEGISKLLRAYHECGCTVSVQPYHQMHRAYEQLSLFFNLVQYAANGLGLPYANHHIGLFGPVILIPKKVYQAIGGHEAIRDSIVDDLALGQRLKEQGIPFQLFLGEKDLAYRMYGGGLKNLWHGWVKNMGTGAVKTPFVLFFMVFVWLTTCASVPIQMALSLGTLDLARLGIYSLFYLIWVGLLRRASRHLGDFACGSVWLYPFYLVVFCGVFVVSLLKKIFRQKVVWKDMEIKLGK